MKKANNRLIARKIELDIGSKMVVLRVIGWLSDWLEVVSGISIRNRFVTEQKKPLVRNIISTTFSNYVIMVVALASRARGMLNAAWLWKAFLFICFNNNNKKLKNKEPYLSMQLGTAVRYEAKWHEVLLNYISETILRILRRPPRTLLLLFLFLLMLWVVMPCHLVVVIFFLSSFRWFRIEWEQQMPSSFWAPRFVLPIPPPFLASPRSLSLFLSFSYFLPIPSFLFVLLSRVIYLTNSWSIDPSSLSLALATS